VEVWQTSNLRPLKLGEEKNKKLDKNITSASATQGGHKKVMQVWSPRTTSGLEMEQALFMAHQEKKSTQHCDNSKNSKSLTLGYNQP